MNKGQQDTKCVDLRIELLELGKIVNNNYQRPIASSRVQKIVVDFDPARLGVLAVNHRRDGSYTILDGQHRLSALRTMGYTHAMASVQEGLTSQQEADFFRRQSENSTPPNCYDRYNAGIVAEDPHFLTIEAILNSYGFCASRKGGPMQITAVSALSRIVTLFGFDVLDRTLGFVASSWPTDSTALRREMLAGFADFAARFRSITSQQFSQRIGDKQPSVLFSEYRRRTEGRVTARNAFNPSMRFTLCAVLIEAYNRGLGSKSKSRLVLDWFKPPIEHSEGGGWS